MKAKLLAMIAVVAMLAVQGCYPYTYGYSTDYYGNSGYVYYDLPRGYHYEYRSSGPVIVETMTGAVITYVALRAMFPHHPWRRLRHEPHFVRDVRGPGHRPPHMRMMQPQPRPRMHGPAPRKHGPVPGMQNQPRPQGPHMGRNPGNRGPRPDMRHHNPRQRQGNPGMHQRPPQQNRPHMGGHRGGPRPEMRGHHGNGGQPRPQGQPRDRGQRDRHERGPRG